MAMVRRFQSTDTVYALGFSWRKRPWVRWSLAPARVVFIRRLAQLPPRAWLALWGAHAPPGLPADTPVVRLEDGFLRSVGLGADLVRPVSWVVDGRGIYLDARQPSDLEVLLKTTDFSAELLQRAQALRQRIVDSGLTKYNTGQGQWQRPAGQKTVLLVVGQVETDASIRWAAPGIRTNRGLLEHVRRAFPQAWVVYKPHPDVLAGLRLAGQGESAAHNFCDEVVGDVPVQQMLPQVDAVHVMTSLTGFEALLRGCPVVCHGQPFYAGWGLTQDMLPVARRGRMLSLDALVAGALLLYPRYFDHAGRRCIEAEQALDALLDWREQSQQQRGRLWRRVQRRVLQIWARHADQKKILTK